jgi:3-dehydroquinate synthase
VEKVAAYDRDLLIKIVETSCTIKARVVEKDERESDYRAVLNFGHTIGHALEAATDYGQFLHGEAVGVGMAQAAALSLQQGFCDRRSYDRIIQLLEKAGLPREIPANVSIEDLLKSMEVDKKAAGGKIKFVMCEGIGKTRFHRLSPAEIVQGLRA